MLIDFFNKRILASNYLSTFNIENGCAHLLI